MKSLGYKPRDVIGGSLINLIPKDDNANVIQLLSSCSTNRRGALEFRLIDKITQNNLWFEVTGQLFTGKDGMAKILLTCHETTARKKYEVLLEKENAHLQELTKMQDDFVANATHELRTPLFLISGAVNFVIDNLKQDLPTSVLQMIETISRGSSRLKDLIELLVDFSDARADELEMKIQSEDLVSVVKKVVQDLQIQIARSSIILILDVPEKLSFDFDPARIYQIIKHLILNAIKNLQDGGTIRVSARLRDTKVMCSIQDNGIGFTDEEKSAIFKKFGKIFRQKSDYHINIQGFGLGLYLAKIVVEKHGGMIWVDSEGRNMGSTFNFVLPYLTKAT
jgi:signal transduction histidine kinase